MSTPKSKKAKHTPGPWTVRPMDDYYGGYVIQEVEAKHSGRTDSKAYQEGQNVMEEDTANACLIEAAPGMLEALELCLRLIDEALPKFDWGRSALDANAIWLLNEVPGKVKSAIKMAEGD